MSEAYGVFGAGGFGREVMPLARQQLKNTGRSLEKLFFVVDHPDAIEINGTRVISLNEFLTMDVERRYLTYAVSDSTIRRDLENRLQNSKVIDWSICAENSIIMDAVQMGAGAIICPFVTITSNVVIGANFHANIYSYVAHDCIIGNFVTFAPAVKCNGNVVIEDNAYIGTGAIIRPGRPGKPLRIGQSAIIGMGAVVTKDVPAGVTVIGNPARIYRQPE